jgi:uncharacterized membrane protein
MGAGALFGFYFTMSVSIMPGLDATEPYAAITANQDIGRATQKSGFFVALLGTPIALSAAIVLLWRNATPRNWLVLSMIGWVAMMVITLTLNVPLNNVLDGLIILPDQDGLADLWASYAVDWQRWNWLRVLTSGLSLVFVAMAIRADCAIK